MKKMNIPIARTSFLDKEIAAVVDALKSGWIVQGPRVREFEEKFEAYTGSPHAIATTSCTTALHLTLDALGIGAGDEVVVPAFSWVTTANVVEYQNGTVVFCDIDLDTFNIDVSKIAGKITPKTRAIIPVHLFGLPADMGPIIEIAAKHDLLVIEDGACGLGSRYRDKHVGNFGVAGAFSFHPRKALTTGEGGMVVTQDKDLAEKMRSLRTHGAETSDLQRHLAGKPYLLPDFPHLGYNYRMTDIQAALGSAQMDHADDIHTGRVELADRYDNFIDTIPWLVKPARPPESEHGFQAYVCLFQPETISFDNIEKIHRQRNAFMDYLQETGIATRPGTLALHTLSYYAKKYGLNPGDFPAALIASLGSITFPLFSSLTAEELEYIFSAISEYDRIHGSKLLPPKGGSFESRL